MAELSTSSTRLGDVCVLGLGVTGQALLEYLVRAKAAGRVGRLVAFGRAKDDQLDALEARFKGACEIMAT